MDDALGISMEKTVVVTKGKCSWRVKLDPFTTELGEDVGLIKLQLSDYGLSNIIFPTEKRARLCNRTGVLNELKKLRERESLLAINPIMGGVVTSTHAKRKIAHGATAPELVTVAFQGCVMRVRGSFSIATPVVLVYTHDALKVIIEATTGDQIGN